MATAKTLFIGSLAQSGFLNKLEQSNRDALQKLQKENRAKLAAIEKEKANTLASMKNTINGYLTAQLAYLNTNPFLPTGTPNSWGTKEVKQEDGTTMEKMVKLYKVGSN